MTIDALRDEVMEELARSKRRDRAELEQELRAAGDECPFDSIYLVRAAVRVARSNGIRLDPKPSIAQAFKSVEGVAALLASLEQGQGAA